MIARKDKQFLVFDFEDGKDVRFDLSTGQFIGKKGKPVKSLTGQLSQLSIKSVIDSFEDEKYRKFLNHVYEKTNKNANWRNERATYYSNVGTFLEHVRNNLNLEQFFACGITNIDISKCTQFSNVPKSLIKIMTHKSDKLTDTLIRRYSEDINMWNMLLSKNFTLFSPFKLVNDAGYRNKFIEFMALINTYKYKPVSLCQYIDNILMYEGEECQDEVVSQLYDYTRMMSSISDKYEKYPRYLRTTHNIATRNYNRLKKEFAEDVFINRIKPNMEYSHKSWIVIYPKSTQSIKDEAVQMSNCVASYIDKVIEGECDILFLRHKDSPDKSVVTLEVRHNKVVQAKGKFNRECNEEEKMVINKLEDFLNNKSNKKYEEEVA